MNSTRFPTLIKGSLSRAASPGFCPKGRMSEVKRDTCFRTHRGQHRGTRPSAILFFVQCISPGPGSL